MPDRPRPSFRSSLLLLVPLIAAACSGGAGTATSAPGAGSAAPIDSSAPATAGASLGTTGHLGDTLGVEDGNGHDLRVTLVKMFDPATSTTAAPAGQHWIGIQLSIVDTTADDPAQTLVVDGMGSDGQRYGLNSGYGIGTFKECIATWASAKLGVAYTECHGFLVPTGVTVASVGYTAAASAGTNDQITWTVP